MRWPRPRSDPAKGAGPISAIGHHPEAERSARREPGRFLREVFAVAQ